MERHLLWLPCTKAHCCDQHKCLDISNQFPEDQLVHYGKHLHGLLHCAALVWENHEGKLKLIKRDITADHGSFTRINQCHECVQWKVSNTFTNAFGTCILLPCMVYIKINVSVMVPYITAFRLIWPIARSLKSSIQIERFGILHCIWTFIFTDQVLEARFGTCKTLISVYESCNQ